MLRAQVWYLFRDQDLRGILDRVLNQLIGQAQCQKIHQVLWCWALDQIPYQNLDRRLDRRLYRILDRILNRNLNRSLHRVFAQTLDKILNHVLEKVDQALEQAPDQFLLSVVPLVFGQIHVLVLNWILGLIPKQVRLTGRLLSLALGLVLSLTLGLVLCLVLCLVHGPVLDLVFGNDLARALDQMFNQILD